MAPKRTTRSTPATTTTTPPVTNAQLKVLIDQGIVDAWASRDADRSRNGDDSHNSGTGSRRIERSARECNHTNFLKCQPLKFKGIEGVTSLSQWFERMESVFHISNCSVENQVKFATCTLHSVALTWCKTHVKIVGHDVAYESDKIEKYVGGLPDMIHGSVMASKPKTMQDAIEIATELMDKKISTLAERQAKNKRKLDNNNQAQQQPPKKQGVAIAYTDGSGERKEYAGTLLLCNKCKFHHNGQCTVKCANCKRVSQLTRDCRSPATTNNQRNLTCYECRNQGNCRSDCLKLKNQNHGNQAGGTGARGMVHALGGGEINQDLNNMDQCLDSISFNNSRCKIMSSAIALAIAKRVMICNILRGLDKRNLKKHVRDMEIELPEDLKEIPTKVETFTSTISSLLSQVAELKNIKWELPAEFLTLPSQVSPVQEKLKILDSLPSLLHKVTDTLTRFATMVENVSGALSMNVPSAGKATASPAEGEKNT
ncbi:hypothetical protein Tco_1334797 [Tanacetum coccineum]